ncbi:MAG: pitrilysin family protein [Gemmatimonadota bacterium]
MSDGIRPAAGPPRPYTFPAAQREQLPNGLTVYVVPLRRLPVATALLMSDAGAECDALPLAGVGSLTVEVQPEGTTKRDGTALADAFEQLGGSLDTSVTWTHSEVGTTVTTARFGAAVHLLAEVARAPSFPESEVTRLREERMAELLQQRAEPRGLADDMFAHVCFSAESRYANPEGGEERTVATITREALVRHHARYVVPARSALIVAGDVDVDAILQLAEDALGAWRGDGVAPPEIAVAPMHEARMVHIVAKPDSPQSELRVGHLSVARRHPDFHALSVMNAILGGLFNSRINLNLRETHAYTYGAFSHFEWRRRASSFETSTAVRSDITGAAVREILGEIDRIRNDLVSPAELSLAVDYLTGVFPIRFETTAAIADALASREGYGLPADYFDRYRERVAAVTAADVLRVAQLHLAPERLQVVAVGDPAIVRADLEALQIGPVQLYDATGERMS